MKEVHENDFKAWFEGLKRHFQKCNAVAIGFFECYKIHIKLIPSVS